MCLFVKKNLLLFISCMFWWIMNFNIYKLNYLVFENNLFVFISFGFVQKKIIYIFVFVVFYIITFII